MLIENDESAPTRGETQRVGLSASGQDEAMSRAVVFDFDGLILDTETPLYAAWQMTFAHYGQPAISVAEWSTSLGRHDDDPERLDPLRRLRELVGADLSDHEVQSIRRRHRDDLLDALPLAAGVEGLLDEADRLGVPVGLASSSPIDWIERHLTPRGLIERFSVLSCAGADVPGKPDPTVYLEACAAMNCDPAASIAFEDSPNGARAARAAGLTCIVVPTDLSAALNFDHANIVIDSLEHVTLTDLFARLSHDHPSTLRTSGTS